ncbi:hypothetical protein J7T55_006701 [Diaporthe amygdali]|uniref:uncharacterized protein n=1 Tax=Phomopsis amygdali TaxID=1214568 RepID=UPI0022FE9578|nr:uncharacterized protein J7T55_006701 [Diaporthe amygdali]KAJ0125355.1 hypothetical protein J7T55_006701 [Diaporthe amygdali]
MATSSADRSKLQSSMFIFVIGEGKTEFRVHGKNILVLSKPLDALLAREMKEAQDCRIEWPDVDEGTFVRFSQWISTQDYDPAEPVTETEDVNAGYLSALLPLYVVGDKWLIPKLKQLTLHRLYATLRDFTLYPNRVEDLCVLATYVFDHTVPGDEMRDLIVMYFACVIDQVIECDDVATIVDGIPGFAFQLIKKMASKPKSLLRGS